MTTTEPLDLSGPKVPLIVDAEDVVTVTVETNISSAATDTWEAMARPAVDDGTFVEWAVTKSGAGTTPHPIVVEVDSTGMAAGRWVWMLWRNGEPFFGLAPVTVREVAQSGS